MEIFLAIVAVAALGLAATSQPAYRLRRSRAVAGLLSTGWPALVIGLLLGPHVSGLIDESSLIDATPLLMIGLGWIGVIVGLQLRREVLEALPRRIVGFTVIDVVITGVVFAVVAWLGLRAWTDGQRPAELWAGMVLIASTAVAWSMETRSVRPAGESNAVQRASLAIRAGGALGAVAAIAAFGIGAALTRRLDDGIVRFDVPAAGVRLALTAVLAIALGIFGRYFLRVAGKQREHELVVFLGVVVFAAGVSAQLGLSPMLGAMLTGAVIANLGSTDLRAFERFVLKAEHTVAVFFSVLAGVLLEPRIGAGGLALVGAIVAARLIVKPLVSRAGYTLAEDDDDGPVSERPQRGLVGLRLACARQSPIAVALAVGLVLAEPSAFNQKLLAVVAFAGLACELLVLGVAAAERITTGDEMEETASA
ncbi:MAG: cation:proton antiporter [Planctomycetota bacterium]